jgi:hypothetical protein
VAIRYPVIGQWFSRANGTLFEVVAIDDPEDFVGNKESEMPSGYHNPLAFLDKL